MSPYKLITGTDKNLSVFEEQISKALQEGYDLANDLVVHPKTSSSGETEVLLFQALICDDALDTGEEEEEEYEDEEELEEEEEAD